MQRDQSPVPFFGDPDNSVSMRSVRGAYGQMHRNSAELRLQRHPTFATTLRKAIYWLFIQ